MARPSLGSQNRERVAVTLDPALREWAVRAYPDLSLSQVLNLLLRSAMTGSPLVSALPAPAR